MKRKLRLFCSILIVAAIILLPLAGCGDPEPEAGDIIDSGIVSGDYIYDLYGDTTASITGYSGAGGDIVLPAELDGHSVTGIGDFAFESNSAITSVAIPEGITDIGDFAFSYCSALVSVSLPTSLKLLGSNIFVACSSLQSVTLPEGLTEIGTRMFAQCAALGSIVIPESVAVIGCAAFEGCTGLYEINIPAGVREIDRWAFRYVPAAAITSLSGEFVIVGDGVLLYYNGPGGNVVIPDGVKYISSLSPYAESEDGYNYTVTSVALPESVTKIGDSAFHSFTMLQSINLPESITQIKAGAFYECYYLHFITLPQTLTAVESSVFAFSGLNSIVLPPSITSIGSNAFLNCTALFDISVPQSVDFIAANAFDNTPWLSSLTNEFVVVGNGLLIKYNGVGGKVVIPENVKLTGGVFAANHSITSVVLSSQTTSIPAAAFANCSGLQSVTIPKSVKSISPSSFNGCPETMVIFGESGSFAESFAEKNGFEFSSI